MRQPRSIGTVSRREILKDGLRWLLAGGLVLTGGVLSLRSGPETRRGSCPPEFVCRDCGRRRSCSRPAKRERQTQIGKVVDHGSR